MPPLMNNHGNFIVSLGSVCRWLATKAEALGVEIYPGFAAAEVLFDENGAVAGIATGDMGVGKNGEPKDSFTRGMELRAKYTLFGEGARGSLGKQLIAKFGLERRARAAEIRTRPQGTLAGRAGKAPQGHGAAFVRLAARRPHRRWLVHVSLRRQSGVGRLRAASQLHAILICRRSRNSSASRPIKLVRDTFDGAKRLAYGARALTEGGYQSVPKLTFPGGALIGCDAGFMNVPRIKGSHNAMLSGMLAAEAVAAALGAGRAHDELADYDAGWRGSAIGKDLWKVRNAKPLWSKLGTFVGIALGGFDMWTKTFGFSLFGTVKHGKPDYATLKPAAECMPIAYPKPDGKLTFDRLSSVSLSNTNHEEDQPVHLHVKDMSLQKSSEHDVYAGPSSRYCPAGVYEWVEEGGRAQIRHQRAELRPLQNLRHQGPESEHHLGSAGRRRRAELSEYVMGFRQLRPRCCHIGVFNLSGERRDRRSCGGGAKRPFWPELQRFARKLAVSRLNGAQPVTSSSLARCTFGTALAVFLVAAPINAFRAGAVGGGPDRDDRLGQLSRRPPRRPATRRGGSRRVLP